MAPVRFDGPNYKVFIGDHQASTAGKLALRYLISPTGKWVAVLSAPGPVLPQLFFEGDRVLGQRYHQVLSVPDAVSAGRSTRIPILSTDTTLRLCWFPDEKLVVYTDADFSSLVVVDTMLTPPTQ